MRRLQQQNKASPVVETDCRHTMRKCKKYFGAKNGCFQREKVASKIYQKNLSYNMMYHHKNFVP